MAMQAGLTAAETVFMSVVVMAGSSQIMAVGMIAQGAAAPAIILATFFINLRHLVMSSSIMRRLGHLSLVQKLCGAYALCDESFAVFSLTEDEDYFFFLGSNTLFCSAWIASTAVGCVLNHFLPTILADSLGIAFYAAFLGMLLPAVRANLRLLGLVVFTALVNSVLQSFLPSSWAVVLSMVGCAAVGTFVIDPEETEEKNHEN